MTSANDPIAYAGLAEEASRRLRSQILSGDLGDGDRIIERDAAERMGLSRGPIREALKQLALEGLVVILPRRGARVVSMTRSDAEEILAIRAAVEPLAAQFFLERRTNQAFAVLEDCLTRLKQAAAAQDWSSVVVLDMEFHGLVYKLSGRKRLQQIWEQLHVPLLQTVWIRTKRYESLTDVPSKHQHLLDTMRRGQAPAVRKVIREHVLEFQEDFLDAMAAAETSAVRESA